MAAVEKEFAMCKLLTEIDRELDSILTERRDMSLKKFTETTYPIERDPVAKELEDGQTEIVDDAEHEAFLGADVMDALTGRKRHGMGAAIPEEQIRVLGERARRKREGLSVDDD